MKVAEALYLIRRSVGTDEEARRQLQQAFADSRIRPWGRAEIPPTTFDSPVSATDIWSEIRPDYWHDFRLTKVAFKPEGEPPQTEAREHVTKGLMRRFWNIRVDRREIEDEWPKPSPQAPPAVEHFFRTGEDLIEAKPDLRLAGVLARVYAKIGPPLEVGSREEFEQLVDSEIADGVKFNQLHVWGRSGPGRALEEINQHLWESGVFDHREKRFSFYPAYSNVCYLIDLRFCKAEVDKVWPEPARTSDDERE